MKIRSYITAALTLVAITLGSASTAMAASPASFSAAASASSVQPGQSVGVSFYENGTDVNVVTVKFTYDTTRLQLLSVTCGSGFNTQPETNGATCYTAGGSVVNGTMLAANAQFKALADGSAAVTVASGSMIVSNGANIWNGVAAGATIVIATPAPTQPATPNPPATGGGTSTPPATSTPKPTATPKTTTATTTSGEVLGDASAQQSAETTPQTETPSVTKQSEKTDTPKIAAAATNKSLMASVGSLSWFVLPSLAVLGLLLGAAWFYGLIALPYFGKR